MPTGWVASVASYFDRAAASYATDIQPAFAPLAAGLVDLAALQTGEQTLDLGTGSGAAAREAAGRGGDVLSLDISLRMLREAQRQGTPGLVLADIHALPFRNTAFDLALAAFVFNSSDPALALPEVYRVLRPGGRLALQEWGTPDDLSELVTETVGAYAVESPSPELAAFRQAMTISIPWDDLESIEALLALLEQAGFEDVDLETVTASVIFPSVATFLKYKLAWPLRHVELDNMNAEVRALCLSDLKENLSPYANSRGQLVWQPEVFRIRAQRPG